MITRLRVLTRTAPHNIAAAAQKLGIPTIYGADAHAESAADTPDNEPGHGTYSRYVSGGCRCHSCRAAWRQASGRYLTTGTYKEEQQ